jgi:hypothetical protein
VPDDAEPSKNSIVFADVRRQLAMDDFEGLKAQMPGFQLLPVALGTVIEAQQCGAERVEPADQFLVFSDDGRSLLVSTNQRQRASA